MDDRNIYIYLNGIYPSVERKETMEIASKLLKPDPDPMSNVLSHMWLLTLNLTYVCLNWSTHRRRGTSKGLCWNFKRSRGEYMWYEREKRN